MDKKAMKSLLECPVCFEVRATHIYQCNKGHIICAVCKANKSITRCPSCKCNYDDPPCRSLQTEKFIRDGNFEFSCKFADRGCDAVEALPQHLMHESKCLFRKVFCPDRDCGQTVNFIDMVEHFREHHKNSKWNEVSSGEASISWPVNSRTRSVKDQDWVFDVLEFDGRKFIERFRKFAETGFYHAWVVILGDETMADEYSAEITAFGNGAEFKKRCKVHAVDRMQEDVMKDEDCFLLNENQVKQLETVGVKNPQVVKVKYKVQKINATKQ